jgi:acetylornithine deacetylase/succinyl-diaminopimelate desuccinylase-like protein
MRLIMQSPRSSAPPRVGLPLLAGGLAFIVLLSCAAGEQTAQRGLAPPKASAAATPQHQQALRDIYKELIEINTTAAKGSCTRAAQAMVARLKAAGFRAEDMQVILHPRNAAKGNLVVRMRGTGAKKPLLLLAHLDVVEALREDWSEGRDPFQLTEQDGYFYGRGTSDDKAMAAIFVANLIRFKQEGFTPNRDIILALTADEEGGPDNGALWLVENHRDLVDAELGINEGGSGAHRKGKRLYHGIQASEKIFQSFSLEVTNKGGHSSLPVKDNAIYRLSAALERLSKFDFPVSLNDVTRAYFDRMASIEAGQTAADMKAVAAASPDLAAAARLASSARYNAMMRTTCVATQLQGGHAENALPQRARAVVNCRILPQDPLDEVKRTLVRVAADEEVYIEPLSPPKPSPPSPLTPAVMKPIEDLTRALWPGVPVIPIMGTGASDSLYFRRVGIPMYGVSGLFQDIDDVRAHGKDERLSVSALFEGQEFLYRLVKSMSGGK